jgi:hypothetical protein
VDAKKMGAAPSNAFDLRAKAVVAGKSLTNGVKALEEHRFRPMYAGANIEGHPSRTIRRGWEIDSAGAPQIGTPDFSE